MRRLSATLAGALALLCLAAAPAGADFGLREVGFELKDLDGSPSLQAGAHPDLTEILVDMNAELTSEGGPCAHPVCEVPEGAVRDLDIDLPAGFVADPLAVPQCSAADFATILVGSHPACPDATVLGIQALKFSFDPIPAGKDLFLHVPIYNLEPPPGAAAKVGFVALGVPVTVEGALNPDPPYNAEVHATDIAQAALFNASVTTLWGDPGAEEHDPFRGSCLDAITGSPLAEPLSLDDCELDSAERAFTTAPRSCTGPLQTVFTATSWPLFTLGGGGELVPSPSETDEEAALTEPGMVDCAKLDFEPQISARPTTEHADSPTGLEFTLRIEDPDVQSAKEGAIAQSDLKRAVVTLPEGVTINPSQAEGLAVCTEQQLGRETASSEFGEGCPAASKIGTVEVTTPLLEGETLKGSLFVAAPFENRFGSLIAFYQVVKLPERGIVVKLAGKVEPDPRTGQLVAIVGRTEEELPQTPFTEFRLRFREGGRSPLITPQGCGTYTTEALLTPWASPADPVLKTASFEIDRGVGGGPCPSGPRPFEPGFSAGTLSNSAGSHSPFHMRLTRRDGDQDLTRFDAKLPPGLVAKLAGVAKCSDAAIARARARSGRAELADPSCPAASKIGSVQGGAGVGSQLTYVSGSIYLAGPFGGAPLSVLAVVPAVAGPFDVGVVLTRQALRLDPVTGQPEVDGAASEPIPHILAGIPLRVRDIQVSVDRPQFVLNPTSCDPMAIGAAIWGGGLDPFGLQDDAPVGRSVRFQAANCLNLGFRPRLAFRLKGGTRRGAHPAFKAILRPRPGDANLAKTVVRFPRATFLEQAHIRTVCTRVQFAADACPPGSVYGRVTAHTPLLDEPLRGPVYLRSSDNLLPDIVFDLRGEVEIEAAARADSVKGRLRITFPAIPDAPVSKVVVEMQGARKGLLVNSRDICSPVPRAKVLLEGHNAKRHKLRTPLRSSGCGKARR